MLKQDLNKLIEFGKRIDQHMPMMKACNAALALEVRYREEQKNGALDTAKYTSKFLARMVIADKIQELHAQCGDWKNAEVVELLRQNDQLLRVEVDDILRLQPKSEQEVQREEQAMVDSQ
jgi:hypothetical protein